MVRPIVLAALAALSAAAASTCTRTAPSSAPGCLDRRAAPGCVLTPPAQPAPPREPGRCEETLDCPNAEICLNTFCVNCGGCLVDGDCPVGHICEGASYDCPRCIADEPVEPLDAASTVAGSDSGDPP